MCLAPNRIKNPYYGKSRILGKSHLDTGFGYLHDCSSQYLSVPCGHCPSCIALRQSYKVQRSQIEEMDNDLFFCTLTYNNEMIPTTYVNGFKLYYPDYRDLTNMMKRLRKYNKFGIPFKYFAVSEYGSRTHRPHFHLIWSFPRPIGMIKDTFEHQFYIANLQASFHNIILEEWSRNVGTNKFPIYKPLCTYKCTNKFRTFDFHYITPKQNDVVKGSDDVSFYVTKYVLKADPYVKRLKSALYFNLDPEEFKKVWNLFKPRAITSKGWGLPSTDKSLSHIRKGIDTALRYSEYPYPVFINPHSGQTFPLDPYYKKKFLSVDDAHKFYFKADGYNEFVDNLSFENILQRPDILSKYTHFKNIQKCVANRNNNSDDYYEGTEVYIPDDSDLLFGLDDFELMYEAEISTKYNPQF